MKTKKIALVLLAITMCITVAAQETKKSEEKAKRYTETKKQELQLTDEQEAQFLKSYSNYFIELDKLKAESKKLIAAGGTETDAQKQEMKGKRRALFATLNAELKPILTAEQFTKLEQIREQEKEKKRLEKEQKKNANE